MTEDEYFEELEYLRTDLDAPYPCPDCGGKPTIKTAQWGNAYFALCGSCGWEGGVRQVESTPFAALSHWPSKFLNT